MTLKPLPGCESGVIDRRGERHWENARTTAPGPPRFEVPMASCRYRRSDLSLTHRLELGDRVFDALETENQGARPFRLATLAQRFVAPAAVVDSWDLTRLVRSLGEAIRRGDSEAVDRLQRILGNRAGRHRLQR